MLNATNKRKEEQCEGTDEVEVEERSEERGILECWVGSVLGALSPGGEFTTASVGPDVFPHAHNPREAAGLPQVNATEDVAKLQQGLSWTTTVAAWQRLQVLADPVLLAVLTLVMAVLTVMLQLFHDLFALFVMQ
ncbi:hypothetical protein FHG87_023933, partial [Trinorchestia longiramus]